VRQIAALPPFIVYHIYYTLLYVNPKGIFLALPNSRANPQPVHKYILWNAVLKYNVGF
jgi:hypothetical protein